MEIKGWKYYNHAAIPDSAPHQNPNLSPIEDGSIWKIDGGTPLLARWTCDFDCGYQTNWWYVIKDAPFDMDDVSAKERKSVRRALRKCYVQKIIPTEHTEELYECYLAAFSKYENADNMKRKQDFEAGIAGDTAEYWGGFDSETNMLIGYMTVYVYDVYVEISTAKFNPEFLSKQVSDALYYNVLDHYLNQCGKKYVCSGTRSINHKTNSQEYKIKKFGYRKAYCRLHMVYNPKILFAIKILYPFRKLLAKMDNITIIHQINAVLLMEEVNRS